MTYTFKISRRLARIRSVAQLAIPLFVLSSCAPGEAIEEGFAPPPDGSVVALQLSPDSVTVAPHASATFVARGRQEDGTMVSGVPVSWTSTGGAVSAVGVFTAADAPGRYHVFITNADGLEDSAVVVVPAATVISVSVAPSTITLVSGQSQQFTASAGLSDGSSLSNPAATWTAQGGSITADGRFTAGSTAGTFRVVTAFQGHADTASVTVTVPPATINAITVTPPSVGLQSGQTQLFTASAALSDGTTQDNAPVSWAATGGTISTGGFYSAGSTAGTFRAVATAANGKADTSIVTITVPAATVSSIILTPGSTSLQSGASQQFTVSATMSDGSTLANPAVSWSATGGNVSASGSYTAGSTAGTFRVIASSGNGKADTSTVTVTVPPATISSLTVTPGTVNLLTGATQQFNVSAQMSDGSTQASPAVTWNATGGTVTSAGGYTAGSMAGTFRVVASSSNGRADTAIVNLSAPAATIVALVLTPAAVSLQAGQAQQFAVSATMSDGSTQGSPSVAWSATGGSVSAGNYTAGNIAGSYRVIVSSAGKADTSTVTLTVPAPTLNSLTLTPATITLPTGSTQQMSVSGQWSDGSTSAPAVTYSATGGSITMGGLYTAGGSAGTFRIVAVQQGGTRADTSVVTVTASTPPPQGGVNPNEPAGYTRITNNPLDVMTADGWSEDIGTPTKATDPTAPVSPSGVARANMPAGMNAGGGIWTLERSLPGTTRLYMSLAFKLSANYQGEPSGTNKLAFAWIHNNPSVFLSTEGGGSGNLIATIRLQNVPDARGNSNGLAPNLGKSGVVSRGVWHTWEVELISNTNGGANGIARWWLDGVLIGEHTNVEYASAGQARVWHIASLCPIWGGMGGVVSQSQSIDFDNIYLSGAN